MNARDTAEFLRDRLVKDITQLLCKRCSDPRSKGMQLNFDDPLQCPCRCATVEPLLQRLKDLDEQMRASDCS